MRALFAEDDSTALTDYIIHELATIWNITGFYPPPDVPATGGAG